MGDVPWRKLCLKRLDTGSARKPRRPRTPSTSWGDRRRSLCEPRYGRDEIAFLLGHEMAHIVRRHALDRIIKDAALSLLLRQSSGKNAASAWLGKAGRQLLSRAYSREDELDADAFAVALVGTAGGDALAGERLLEKLAQGTLVQSVGITGDYFATHPSPLERVANLRAKRQS